jgi:pimeloyl-ACP methyl ester carboxylesterase
MPARIEERTFDAGVVTINYAEGLPSGPPLLFLHGGSGRWQSYGDIILDLAARFHLYAPDLRGHGGSGRVPGRYRLRDYADDTIAFLRRCVARPAHLFGHSLGGMVALVVASQCAECVRSVVVGDSPLAGRTARSCRSRARTAAWRDLAGGRLTVDEIVEALWEAPTEMPGRDAPVTMREKYGQDPTVLTWLATNLYHNDPEVLTAVLDGTVTAGYDMEKVLPAIRCPVLLVQADPDEGGVMADPEVERAIPLLREPHHIRLEQTGHFFFSTQNTPLLQRILEFLRAA